MSWFTRYLTAHKDGHEVVEPVYDEDGDFDYDDDSDVWEDSQDYGYADANFIGTDEWEDQKGMEELKISLKLDPNWFLVKVINFDHRSLAEQIEWLKENCKAEYKRVGYSSGCSTKVAVAFELGTDAFFYKLRWR